MSTTLLVYPWPAPLSRYQVTHLTVHVLLIAAAHVTLGQCSVLWHGHVGSSARCSSQDGVDTTTIWSPVNLRYRAGHGTSRAGQQINWMTCPRWIKIKMIFLAQLREWITFLNEMTFGNHFPGNLGLGSVLVDSLNILRYFYAWFLMAWEFLAPCTLLASLCSCSVTTLLLTK